MWEIVIDNQNRKNNKVAFNGQKLCGITKVTVVHDTFEKQQSKRTTVILELNPDKLNLAFCDALDKNQLSK